LSVLRARHGELTAGHWVSVQGGVSRCPVDSDGVRLVGHRENISFRRLRLTMRMIYRMGPTGDPYGGTEEQEKCKASACPLHLSVLTND
jgi:hypothetical protein